MSRAVEDVRVEPAGPRGVERVAPYVARLQAVPERHIAYVGLAPDEIHEELAEIARVEERLLVARRGDAVVGVVLPDVDDEMRRVWWFGPWAEDPAIGRALVEDAARRFGAAWAEEEFSPDARNTDVAALALGRGCVANTGSAVLCFDVSTYGAPDPSGRTSEYRREDAQGVVALHDRYFSGSHTTGARLVEADGTRLRVARGRGRVTGYVAAELQPGGHGYIDYVAVDEHVRRRGVGRDLVRDAIVDLADEGVTDVNLTVRVDRPAARALYRSLGFEEERVIAPFRRGFDLG